MSECLGMVWTSVEQWAECSGGGISLDTERGGGGGAAGAGRAQRGQTLYTTVQHPALNTRAYITQTSLPSSSAEMWDRPGYAEIVSMMGWLQRYHTSYNTFILIILFQLIMFTDHMIHLLDTRQWSNQTREDWEYYHHHLERVCYNYPSQICNECCYCCNSEPVSQFSNVH